ncbi:MAG TPA: hypothetical protein VNN98_04390 [Rhizomicrobium sp.]|nr:hypothetical protein [Rhizomicrobium sp.]
MKTLLILIFAFSTALTSSTAIAAGGCGPGWHRGSHGRCVRNYMRPHRPVCPRGYHLSRLGRCRPNY